MADNSDLGRKILVAGQGGKSSLARVLAADLSLPYIELDALTYEPDWVPVSPDEFRVRVRGRWTIIRMVGLSMVIRLALCGVWLRKRRRRLFS